MSGQLPTTRRWRAHGAWILTLLIGASTGVASAQDSDPPGRVARLSDAEGSVSLQPAGVQDWTSATINRPITTGDRLWSDQSSRAELDLGSAALRLGSNTGFAFLNLDDRSVQMQLSAGGLIVSVRDLPSGESYEVDTPNIALIVQQPGVYRIEVNDEGTATAVGVSQGAAEAAGGGQTVAIGAQQRVTFTGTDTLAWQSATLGAPDQFDDWSALRERQAAEGASSGYVASDIPGTQDLDHNGEWQQTPEYGSVWVPTVVAGWAPYRYGQWVWVTPWGWTWVDDAPWGYAPFHYGRWVVWQNSWCWVPTPRHGMHGRAVYAPALVAWVGAVPGGRAAPGHVSWFPLGPREVYVPPYRVSTVYVRNVNVTNTTVVDTAYITNIYQNNLTPWYVNYTPNAVTTVPRSTFISGQRVRGHALQVSPAELSAAAATAAAPAIVPTRQSVLGASSGPMVARPPLSLMQRTLIVRSPPPPAPVPFERQIPAIEAGGGRPPTRGELALLQHAAALAPVKMVPGRVAAPSSAARGPPSDIQSLAERERRLQQSAFPSARPGNAPSVRSAVGTDPYAALEQAQPRGPPLRNDRPPTAQQHPSDLQQRTPAADDASRGLDQRTPTPVYQFPSGSGTATRVQGVHPGEAYRPAPTPAPHTSAAPHATAPVATAPVAAAPLATPFVAPPPVAHPPPSTPTRAQWSHEPTAQGDRAPTNPR